MEICDTGDLPCSNGRRNRLGSTVDTWTRTNTKRSCAKRCAWFLKKIFALMGPKKARKKVRIVRPELEIHIPMCCLWPVIFDQISPPY